VSGLTDVSVYGARVLITADNYSITNVTFNIKDTADKIVDAQLDGDTSRLALFDATSVTVNGGTVNVIGAQVLMTAVADIDLSAASSWAITDTAQNLLTMDLLKIAAIDNSHVTSIQAMPATVGSLDVQDTQRLLDLVSNDSALSIDLKDTAHVVATHISTLTAAGVTSVTIDGTSAAAADLKAIDTASSVSVGADNVATITGNAADVAAVVSSNTINTATNVAVSVNAITSATAQNVTDLNTIATNTTGSVNASITGEAANLAGLQGSVTYFRAGIDTQFAQAHIGQKVYFYSTEQFPGENGVSGFQEAVVKGFIVRKEWNNT
jgi:hypothetical protein